MEESVDTIDLQLLDYVSYYEYAKTKHRIHMKILLASLYQLVINYWSLYRRHEEFAVFKDDIVRLWKQCKIEIKALNSMTRYIKQQSRWVKKSKTLLNNCRRCNIK